MLKRFACLCAMAAMAAGGCSDEDVDATGSYTLALTNGDNGCEFMNWTVGESSTGVALDVTQDGSDVVATVGTGGAFVLDVILGSHVFTGSVSGNDLDLKIIGTPSFMDGACTFTVTARVAAAVDGNNINGTIDYTTATNHSPECGAKEDCHSVQNFSGARPPPAQ